MVWIKMRNRQDENQRPDFLDMKRGSATQHSCKAHGEVKASTR